MAESVIKDNAVMHQKKYPKGCLFKSLQLRTSMRDMPFIYRVEMISKTNDSVTMGFRKSPGEAERLYNDIASLSPAEIESAFGSMA